DEHRAVLDLAVGDGEDGGVVDGDDGFRSRYRHDAEERSDEASPCISHCPLLPLNWNVPRFVLTVPDMLVPLTVPWNTQSFVSVSDFAAMVSSMVVPSNEPLRMSPEPRSPEYVPVTRPSSTCRMAVMLTSPDELFTLMRHVPSSGEAPGAA